MLSNLNNLQHVKMVLFLTVPQNNVYNNLGQECVGGGCSVDLFIFNNSYIDLATIGQICRLTGGEIYKYTYFQVCAIYFSNRNIREENDRLDFQ